MNKIYLIGYLGEPLVNYTTSLRTAKDRAKTFGFNIIVEVSFTITVVGGADASISFKPSVDCVYKFVRSDGYVAQEWHRAHLKFGKSKMSEDVKSLVMPIDYGKFFL